MPIVVTCPSCLKRAQAPDTAAGAKVKCRGCGGVMTVPVVSKQRTCAGCGADVSQRKRTKDNQGNYYCEICWNARQQGAAVSAPAGTMRTPAETIWYPCAVCEVLYTSEDVYDTGGQTVCKTCWEAGHRPEPTAAAAPPPVSAGANPVATDELFCEGCNQLFPPEKLQLDSSGAVLCKQCRKERARAG